MTMCVFMFVCMGQIRGRTEFTKTAFVVRLRVFMNVCVPKVSEQVEVGRQHCVLVRE